MASRTRTYSLNEGSYLFGGYEMGNLNFQLGYETVQSADGVGDGGYFRVTRKLPNQVVRLNGDVVGVGSPKYRNYVPHGCRTGWSAQHIAIAGRPSNGELASKLAARSNPSRPETSLPIIIGELRELPKLFAKMSSGSLLKDLSSDYLRFEFGIKPIIRDIESLVKAQDAIDRRFTLLKKMRDHPDKAVSRTMSLWNGTASEVIKDVLIHNGETVTANVNRSTTHKCWGWIRWTPSASPHIPKSDQALKDLAKKAVYGMKLGQQLSNAWQLMPWSWLADYFGSIGDYLQANQNVVGAYISACCIMDHIQTTESLSFIKVYPGLTATGGRYTYETKQRMPAFPTLSAHLPILSEKQTSILAAVAASGSRYRNSSRFQ